MPYSLTDIHYIYIKSGLDLIIWNILFDYRWLCWPQTRVSLIGLVPSRPLSASMSWGTWTAPSSVTCLLISASASRWEWVLGSTMWLLWIRILMYVFYLKVVYNSTLNLWFIRQNEKYTVIGCKNLRWYKILIKRKETVLHRKTSRSYEIV